MNMTQTVHTQSTHSSYICESGLHWGQSARSLYCAVYGPYLPFTCHANGNENPASFPPPALSSSLIFKISHSVRLTGLAVKSTFSPNSELLQEDNLIRALMTFQAR